MKTVELHYTEHPDRTICFLELHALKRFSFDGNMTDLLDEYPEINNRWMFWAEHYNTKAKQVHKDLMFDLNKGVYATIDEFYEALKHLLKPKVRGIALRDKKKRSGQEAYQREQLGDGFIDNPPLISAAKSAALALADDDAGEDEIVAKALELASEHPCDNPLTDDQMKTLIKVISDQIAKHLKLERIEAKILDEGNKSVYFMYGKIKRKTAVGDTIELGMKSAVELCKCSRSDVKPILKKLEKLGFIYCIQKGKQGRHTGRASLYRRIA